MSRDKRAWSAETFFRKLVTHGREKEEPEEDHAPVQRRAHSTWVIFRDSSSVGTGCQWFGISYLRWALLPRHASCLGGWSVATSLTRRRSPLQKTGT